MTAGAAWALAAQGRYAAALDGLLAADRYAEALQLAGAVGWTSEAYAVATAWAAADATAPDPHHAALRLARQRQQPALVAQHLAQLAALGVAQPVAPAQPDAATLHRWRGDFAAALAAAPDPDGPSALLTLALQAIAADDWPAARANLDRALDADPRMAEAYNWRAEANHKGGDVAGSHADLDQAAICANEFSLATALLRLHISPAGANAGRLDPVLPALCALHPPIAAAEGAHRYMLVQQAIGPTLQLLGWNRSTTVTVGTGDALRHVDVPASPRYRSRQALELAHLLPHAVQPALQDLVARCPESALPLAYLGEWRLFVGDLAGAETALQAAIAQWRQTRWAYAGLATVRLLRGELDDAQRWLDLGRQEMAGEGPPWMVLRGELAWMRGQLPQALTMIQQAVAKQPGRIAARVLLAMVQRDGGDKAALAETVAALADGAPGLASDARTRAGEDAGDQLAAMHAMLRGCRSSSLTVYHAAERCRVVRWHPGQLAIVGRLVAGRMG